MKILILSTTVLATLFMSCSDGAFSGATGSSGKGKADTSDDGSDGESSGQDDGSGGEGTDSGDDATDAGVTDEGGTDADTLTSGDVTKLREKCGTAAELTLDATLDYPATTGTACKWGQDGNLDKADNQTTRAVFGQAKTFSVPDGGVICDITFDGGSASVTYDDFMHFTFDDFVVASVQFTEAEFIAAGMESENGLIRYDPKKHVGKGPYDATLNDRTNSICPKTGSCSMVKSDTAGALSIDTPKSWFDLLPNDVLARTDHDLTVWVTGQAHATDCQHSGLNFTVKIRYVKQ